MVFSAASHYREVNNFKDILTERLHKFGYEEAQCELNKRAEFLDQNVRDEFL